MKYTIECGNFTQSFIFLIALRKKIVRKKKLMILYFFPGYQINIYIIIFYLDKNDKKQTKSIKIIIFRFCLFSSST